MPPRPAKMFAVIDFEATRCVDCKRGVVLCCAASLFYQGSDESRGRGGVLSVDCAQVL